MADSTARRFRVSSSRADPDLDSLTPTDCRWTNDMDDYIAFALQRLATLSLLVFARDVAVAAALTGTVETRVSRLLTFSPI